MDTRCSIPFLIVTLTCLASGQTAIHLLPRQIVNARQLDEQGRTGEALTILEPLMRGASALWDKATLGIACNVLGSIYRDMDRYDRARHFYEHILSSFPSEQQETASAIDNLGELEELAGRLDASKALRLRALHLYEEIKNHAGVALASSNLANLALKQHDLSAASK